jgi:hypothetical protein
MKTIFFSLIFLISIQSYLQASSESKHVKYAEKVMAKAAKFLAQKYGLTPIGNGGSMMKTVDILSLSFTLSHKLNQKKSRELIIACSEDFLAIINNDKNIRPYLKNYPFNFQNIELTIFIHDINDRKIYDPDIGVVSLFQGSVWYKTYDPDKKYGYKSKIKEPFEDALRILNEQ